jgi:hypothetical protein
VASHGLAADKACAPARTELPRREGRHRGLCPKAHRNNRLDRAQAGPSDRWHRIPRWDRARRRSCDVTDARSAASSRGRAPRRSMLVRTVAAAQRHAPAGRRAVRGEFVLSQNSIPGHRRGLSPRLSACGAGLSRTALAAASACSACTAGRNSG